MKILLGSKNPSKRKSLELALKELGIEEYEIVCYGVPSFVDERPIGCEIIRGADNRNQGLKKIAQQEQIAYDYLCSIEGGYTVDENGLPFIVTYCIVEDSNGKKSTGKSLGLRLTKEMFDYVKSGKSLNKLIEEIVGSENNKQNGGITAYLTNNLLSREKVDKDAVISSFASFIFSEQRKELNEKVKEKKISGT